MRIAIVGAGVAGLTAALALQRDGHEVRVYEQAAELRASGFGLNLWANATNPLHHLGVVVPGEPYDHMNFRTGGKQRARMPLPTKGQPHMNGERGALLRAIHAELAPETVSFGTPIPSLDAAFAEGADLLVAADGVASQLRPDAARQQRMSKPWAVWQAVIPDGGHLIEPGGGAVVLTPTRFYGIWRHPDGELCWFVEEPTLTLDATPSAVLESSATEDDPLVREVARLTPVGRLGQWLARDRRPTRRIIGERVVAIGDAAHPMLPCIGQGACTSIEDGVALALALRGRSASDGLRYYRRRRLPITRTRVATAHAACVLRQPSPLATAVAATPLGIPFAHAAGGWLRLLNREGRWVRNELATPTTQ